MELIILSNTYHSVFKLFFKEKPSILFNICKISENSHFLKHYNNFVFQKLNVVRYQQHFKIVYAVFF